LTDIRHNFVASGHEAVINAYRGIEASATAAAKSVDASFRAQTQSAKRAGTDARLAQRDQARAAETAARTQARAAESSERAQTRAAEQLTNKRRGYLRAEIAAGAAAGKAQAQQDRAMQRLRDQHLAADQRRHDRSIAMARRAGERSGRERGNAEFKALQAREGLFTSSDLMAGAGRVGSAIKGIGIGALATGASIFAGVTGAATKDAVRTQEIANRISINARGSGKGFVDPVELRKEFEATAIATPGQKAADIGAAVQAYVTKTGNLEQARQFAGTFATVASATGGDVTDIANAAADISQKFDITGLEEMRGALAALTFQGKEGAFELSAAAEKFARMGSAASAFGFDKGTKGLKTLGGLSQIIQSSTGNADVTSTALSAMLRQFTGQSKKIKRLTGVDVFTDKSHTKTRDIQDLLVETIAGAGGDLGKIQDIFGDEGGQAIKPMIATFNQAQNALGPNAKKEERIAAGSAAVRAQLDKAINAPGNYSELEKDAAQAQTDVTARLTAAWEKVISVAGEKLLPVVTELAEAIADSPELIDAFKSALETLISMLEELGIIKNRTGSAEDRREKARKEAIDAFKKSEALGDIKPGESAETTAKRVELAAKYNIASETARREDAFLKIARKEGMSQDDIANQYLALGGKGRTPEEEMNRVEWAKKIATTITSKSGGEMVDSDQRKMVGSTGLLETQEQMEFRRNQSAMSQTTKAEGGGLVAAAEALKEAAAKLGASTAGNQPSSIAPSPG
jgi:hypothetical protein